MVEQAGPPASEAEPNLSDSRTQFVGSLPRRLEAIRQALAVLEQAPRASAHRDHLRRRIHAFGAAAGVLGFERVYEAFREAELVLGNGGPRALGPAELGLIARTIDLVPSLVLGTSAPSSRPVTAQERRGTGFPTSVLIFGGAPLAESLMAAVTAGGSPLECERTEDPTRAEEIVRVMAPDVAVIDADRPGARELMETLAYDPLLDPVRIVAVGTFDRPEAAADLVTLGVARVLPKPVSPDALKRSVLEVSRERSVPVERIQPIGDVTVEALADRLTQEIRRGLIGALKPQGRDVSVALGDGTDVLAAAWSAVARIRELVTLRSGGAVRFEAIGPEGAIPLAPWMGNDGRATGAGEKRSSEGVSLAGRTIVVADDDPSVVWFLSGLFRAAGATVLEAHDGKRALELTRQAWPDVVVSDVLMPELDGFALCREIKRDVALSDVPVILLSWKEDLLQRVRELGADADGYLRKEATASTVVQRVKEVLLARARVETRVAAGAQARGRLDGLTPRLILEVTCRHGKDAHLTVRDAAFLYEVDVRGGRVRTATRTSSDGRAETGERALATLLGVRAGRFAVRRDVSACPEDWDRELKELVEAPVERARAAQGLLADPRKVARVEMDSASLEPYLAATPGSVRAIAERLAEGEAPENIVSSGVASSLMESVLVDAVLHGAVLRLVGRNGNDLLAKEVETNRSKRAAFVLPLAASARAPALVLEATTLPLSGSVQLPPAMDEEIAAPHMVAPTEEDVVPPMAAATVPEDPAMVPAATEHDGPGPLEAVLVPARHGAASDPVRPFEAALEPRAAEGFGDALHLGEGFESLLTDSVPPSAFGDRPEERHALLKPKTTAPSLSAPAGLSPLETAVLSVEPPTSARSRFTSSVPPPSSDRKDEPLFELSKPPKASEAITEPEQEPFDLPPTVDAASDAAPEPKSDAAPELTKKAELPAVDLGAAIAAFGEAGDAPKTASRETSDLGNAISGERPIARAAPSESTETPREGGRAEPFGPSDVSDASAGASEAGAASSPEMVLATVATGDAFRTDPKRSALRGATATTTPSKGEEASAGLPRATGERSPQQAAAPKLRERTEDRDPARRLTPVTGGSGPAGTLGIAAVVCVAAFASFSLVRAIRGTPGADEAPAAAASTMAAVASASAAPAPSAPPARALIDLQDMELPLGLAVDADRGLLEVEIGTNQNLYVDGVLIGPGPFRQLPLREGPHQLRVSGDGVDLARAVEIRKGRRARIGVTGGR